MPQPNDLSRSLVALDQNSTIIAVIEMSQSSWLVAGMLPGIERQPRKKLEPSPGRLLGLLQRWRDEAVRAGHTITRIAVAFEAGRDGFWLARWLAARGIEAHVIHASSVAVSRDIAERKPTGSIPSCSSAGSWGGCVENGAIAACNQHEQNLIPVRSFAARSQPLRPELIQLQLAPQHQGQPACAPLPRPTQLQLRQLDVDDRGVRRRSRRSGLPETTIASAVAWRLPRAPRSTAATPIPACR